MLTIGQLTDRWLPPVADPEQRSRLRFGFQAWLISWPVAALWMVVSAIQGIWLQVALNGLLVLLGPLAVRGMRRSGSMTPWFQVSLGAALLLYGPGLLAQTPVDETSMFVASIIPLVAGFVFGGWSAVRWTVLTALVCIGCMLLAQEGYSLPATDATPTLTKALNITSALLMLSLFSARFHAVRVEALANSESANRAKSVFLASVSHEIRTPMNGVLGMTEVMLQEANDPAVREQLEVIHRSGTLLVALLNDVLDVTKLEAQRLSLERADFDLGALLGDVGQLFAPQAREQGLTLEVELEPGLATARRGDSLRLRQVLFNLVSNGVKFTERGRVTVSARAGGGDLVHFSVEDTGIGIAPDVQARLFSMFEQADASTTRRFGGTGLGLALARPLVAMMGGQLLVDSTEGAGSRFHFSVPLEPGLPQPAPRPRTRTVDAALPPVLVVDDNPINLKVAEGLLRKAGYQVLAVASGAEAVQAAGATGYLAVLMDCHMPGMDGFEATTRIRALPAPFGEVPVIALTASTSEVDLEACRSSGMVEVLTKPVSLAALERALAPLRSRLIAKSTALG